MSPKDQETPVRCQKCGGSGTVPRVQAGPYVEDGPVAPDVALNMCERCLGLGEVMPKKRGGD